MNKKNIVMILIICGAWAEAWGMHDSTEKAKNINDALNTIISNNGKIKLESTYEFKKFTEDMHSLNLQIAQEALFKINTIIELMIENNQAIASFINFACATNNRVSLLQGSIIKKPLHPFKKCSFVAGALSVIGICALPKLGLGQFTPTTQKALVGSFLVFCMTDIFLQK